MAYTHTNRKDNVYYLHQGKTKTGKPKYYFSQSDKGDTINSIPDGYEVYENANAQVFLRRIQPKIITDEEIQLVKDAIKSYTKLSHFFVEAKGNKILVYTPDQDLDGLDSMLSPFAQLRGINVKEYFGKRASFTPMMRFILSDKEERTFYTERYCFRGSIDDWIYLGSSSGTLLSQLMLYIKHLGQESFYELM